MKTNPLKGQINSNSGSAQLIFMIIATVAVAFAGGYFFNQYQLKKTANPSQTVTPTKATGERNSTSPGTDMSDWKTYTNETLNYSIKYPSDWVIREFPDTGSGAAFRPANTPSDYQYEYISINKYGKVLFDELPNPTFEEYVKKAGAEIQNYNSLATIKEVVTDGGITGYTTTWRVTSMGSGKAGTSSPRTYFEIPGNDMATIQIEVNNEKYIETYNKMVSTFTITEAKKQVKSANPNLKTFTSLKHGLSFTYLENQNSQTIAATEDGNKICVSYKANDTSCQVGQSVEVFEKGKTETLKDAIIRLFLVGKDPARCLITISDPSNYPETFVKGEITFPKTAEFDLEQMSADTQYCSQDYAQTNGIRYFLEDKLHPTKFFFFSIGQYGIMSDENKSWAETIVFK